MIMTDLNRKTFSSATLSITKVSPNGLEFSSDLLGRRTPTPGPNHATVREGGGENEKNSAPI
jgi:hypothetical protein